MKSRTLWLITILNVLLILITIICLFKIGERNRSLNSVKPTFEYTEKGDAVHLSLADHRTVILKFGKGGISIEDAHRYDNPEDISTILLFSRYYSNKLGYEMTRSNSELIGEYRLHTILFCAGYKQEQTGTLNWDYEDDPRWYVNTASSVLGWFGV